MKAREKSIEPEFQAHLVETVYRLIELYTALKRPDDATKWRTERAKYPVVAPPPREKKFFHRDAVEVP
jgi:eukaryotic-like serine/threonine-protein kinase